MLKEKMDEIKGFQKNKAVSIILNFIRNNPILFIIIVLFIILSIAPINFFSAQNAINIIKQVTIIGIVSIGLTFAIIGGNIDLSVGSLFSLCGIIAITLQPYGLPIAISVTFIVAITVGFLNGYIISKFQINSLLTTLGMLSVLSAIANLITKGQNRLGDPESPYRLITSFKVWRIPGYVFIFIILVVILHIILSRTRIGRNIYLMGNNRDAAQVAGIKITNFTIISFVISALCVAISTILLSSRLSSAGPISGEGYEFDALTAVVIGGNSILGGKGNILKTFLGVILLGIITNGMILLDLPYGLQRVIMGLLLITAVLIDIKSRKRALI